MIHNFLDNPKIMGYEVTIYFVAHNQNFHLLGLIKDKHYEDLNLPTLFYGQPHQFYEGFSYQQIVHWEFFNKYFKPFLKNY
jgi:hypothetical protein